MSTVVARSMSVSVPSALIGPLLAFVLLDGFIQGSVVSLLPVIRDALHTTTGPAMWITAAQFLSAAVCVPAFGRLGDLYGHRRMLRVALGSITLGSLLCALAPTLALFLTGRVLLGPLSALLPLSVGLVRDRLDTAGSRRAISLLAAALILGATAGTATAGPLASVAGGGRTVLWNLVVLAGAGFVLALTPRIAETGRLASGRMDWTGAVLLGLGLTLLLGSIAQGTTRGWGSPPVVGGLLLAPMALGLWVRSSLRSSEPLVDVRAMASRAIAPVFACGFTAGVVILGGQGVTVAFLDAAPEKAGYGFGLPHWQIGLWIAVPALISFLTAGASASVGHRLGYRTMLALAFLLVGAGFGVQIVGHAVMATWYGGHLLSGVGVGLAVSGLPTVITEGSPQDRAAASTAVYYNLKTAGGSVAGAAAAAVFSGLLIQSTHQPSLTAYLLLWSVCGVLALASAALIRLSPRR
ncbi:MFS transporter [Streptomyces noursei]|uniref:MFS transporter n=1 Tax=Streptomyces noursei TaxID=1971 RepID=UPI00199E8458|nr:MFS transporter [Streptomyces noursei]MCZ1020765.1 MFS transporter [Streptomyces noursei]GGX28710.1 MFS transporter [Streptomyces noursei]